ncbi:hypothetical protein F4553_000980 [Allocatelliglobosispora scoriae]|uniref:Uncharacterized protein n=1 Tax=Allocatelliglobosispora scoriae TaxID=643052 RepID=A0A841BL59_9ACTN|nr:hypothetical protein [Allocatelliglobosispora scoriae]MBB5867601.1 hypothetical protein [Allocatelliglobosispora scoriae]
MAVQPHRVTPRSGARPGRRAVVAPDLALLHGPTAGVVELPHRLFWQADRHVDLDNGNLLRWLYETVLREAITVQELQTWLDGPTLRSLWDELYVPAGVRVAWESRHPGLKAVPAAV